MNANPSSPFSIEHPARVSIATASNDAGRAETCILIVDRARRLIRASEAGARMLRRETALRLVLDRVRGIAQIDDARLARAIDQTSLGVMEQLLPLEPKGGGLSVQVVTLPGPDRELEVMLLVRDAREDRRRALARAVAVFAFTRAETRLVTALCDGCSVPDAADRLGVAPTTARSHLQAVFAKTGVRRQGDLLTLLADHDPTSGLAFA